MVFSSSFIFDRWLSILLFKGFPPIWTGFFLFQNTPISLGLSRDKVKGFLVKLCLLTLAKILPIK